MKYVWGPHGKPYGDPTLITYRDLQKVYTLNKYNLQHARMHASCLYGPSFNFHVTPVDLCIIFQCNLYIILYHVM